MVTGMSTGHLHSEFSEPHVKSMFIGSDHNGTYFYVFREATYVNEKPFIRAKFILFMSSKGSKIQLEVDINEKHSYGEQLFGVCQSLVRFKQHIELTISHLSTQVRIKDWRKLYTNR